MRLSKSSFLILIIVLIGFFVRFYKITSSPEGLYIDETSIGYNAYSIISTGRDEHGSFMPLFFEAFGEYKLPVYIYLVALVQSVIGPSDLSVRIPSLVFGTLSIPLIYLFSGEIFRNFRELHIKSMVGILAGFLFAVSPWHFQFSRPGFEASVGLFLLILGLYLFLKGVNKSSKLNISLSFIFFVMTLYSYNSARIVTPLVLLLLFLMYLRNFDLKSWVKMAIPALILAIPFLGFSLSPEGFARARQVSVFFQDGTAADILSNYSKNISPLYLFKEGDPTFNHLTIYRMSLLYLVEVPFFFFGLTYLILARFKNFLLIVALFFIALIPPALATLNPHALRGMLVLSATPIITAFGFGYFLFSFKSIYLRRIMSILFVIVILASTLSFLDTYHGKYAPTSGWDWQVGIKRASLRALELEGNYNDIYFDVDPRLIPVLWYLKIDPGQYQKAINKSRLGKFHINDTIFSTHGLYIGSKSMGTLINYVYYPDGKIAYGIWEF